MTNHFTVEKRLNGLLGTIVALFIYNGSICFRRYKMLALIW